MIDSIKHSAALSQCRSHCLLIHGERNGLVIVSSILSPWRKCPCVCPRTHVMTTGAVHKAIYTHTYFHTRRSDWWRDVTIINRLTYNGMLVCWRNQEVIYPKCTNNNPINNILDILETLQWTCLPPGILKCIFNLSWSFKDTFIFLEISYRKWESFN